MARYVHLAAKAHYRRARTRVRFACDGRGNPSVVVVRLFQNQRALNNYPDVNRGDAFRFYQDELWARGYRDRSLKYLAFAPPRANIVRDGNAEGYRDSSPSQNNLNNRAAWAWVGAGPRGNLPVMMHEWLHTMGAAQPGSPHFDASAPAEMHLESSDGYVPLGRFTVFVDDIMASMSYFAPPRFWSRAKLCTGSPIDCGGDDYFNPMPRRGSWLARHWNVAGVHNDFLFHGVKPPPDAAAPDIMQGRARQTAATADTVTFTWLPGHDNRTRPDKLEYQITLVDNIDGTNMLAPPFNVESNSATIAGLAPGTAYAASIAAIDGVGNVSDNVGYAWDLGTLGATDTLIPGAVLDQWQSAATHTTATVNWLPAGDNVGVVGYQLFVRPISATEYPETPVITVGADAMSATIPGLVRDKVYYYDVRAVDAAGNTSGVRESRMYTRS